MLGERHKIEKIRTEVGGIRLIHGDLLAHDALFEFQVARIKARRSHHIGYQLKRRGRIGREDAGIKAGTLFISIGVEFAAHSVGYRSDILG